MCLCLFIFLSADIEDDFNESLEKTEFNIFDNHYIETQMCFVENNIVFIILYWETFVSVL